MTVPAPYDIDGGRVALGAITGAVVALAYFGIQLHAWSFVLLFGGTHAAFGLVVLVPIYYALRRGQMLNVYVAILVGGFLTLLLTLTPFAYILMHASHPAVPRSALLMFLWFFAAGAIGGAVGWLTAIGFRIRPRLRDA